MNWKETERLISALLAQIQDTRYEFLQMEFLTSSSALDFGIVEWEIGNKEVAHMEVNAVEKAYSTVCRFVPTITSPERRDEMLRKLVELRTRLDRYKSDVGYGVKSVEAPTRTSHEAYDPGFQK